MARPKPATRHRATDPGLRLEQFGRVTWVHCPQCDKAARSGSGGVDCRHCGYMTLQKPWQPSTWARLAADDQRCNFCRLPLEQRVRPSRHLDSKGREMVRVKCDNCGETVDYPARYASPPTGYVPVQSNPLYLTTQVAGQTLWVDNLAHLDALEEYLSALVRERGPVRGKTMMARLPAWLKSAGNRPKVIRALRLLRERARKAGIDE